MKKIAWFLIRTYQVAISPLIGPNCRFSPTCSQYALECFQQFPLHKAFWLSLKRVSKCHPFHPGGEDPVPELPNKGKIDQS